MYWRIMRGMTAGDEVGGGEMGEENGMIYTDPVSMQEVLNAAACYVSSDLLMLYFPKFEFRLGYFFELAPLIAAAYISCELVGEYILVKKENIKDARGSIWKFAVFFVLIGIACDAEERSLDNYALCV